MIKLYRNYDPATSDTPVQMVSAYRGLNDIVRMQRGSGVVVNWKQAGGFLHVSGDTRIIRVWDAHTETQLLDLATREESPVTALASESGPSATVLAGFADGVVKVFDRRMDEDDAVVRSYHDHHGWVQNVRWHPHVPGQFLSARYVGVSGYISSVAYASIVWLAKSGYGISAGLIGQWNIGSLSTMG